MLLLSKLMLVPAFLLLLSMAGNRWGPAVAGWLAGLPVVAGPILFFMFITHGASFASEAAAAALLAVVASLSFSVVYARVAQRLAWPSALGVALCAWAAAACCLSRVPAGLLWVVPIALLALALAPRLFPLVEPAPRRNAPSSVQLACRMTAGALLTVAVTWMSGSVGPRWSGLLSVFPVLGIVLAVFSHRAQGPSFAALLLRGMAAGQYAFVAFCGTLAALLPHAGGAAAFGAAALASVLVQGATARRVLRQQASASLSPERA